MDRSEDPVPAASRIGGLIPARTCPQCGRGFEKASHLERHIMSHTKEKPFSCESCGRRYSRYDSLLRHRRVHDGRVTKKPRSQHRCSTPRRGDTNDDEENPALPLQQQNVSDSAADWTALDLQPDDAWSIFHNLPSSNTVLDLEEFATAIDRPLTEQQSALSPSFPWPPVTTPVLEPRPSMTAMTTPPLPGTALLSRHATEPKSARKPARVAAKEQNSGQNQPVETDEMFRRSLAGRLYPPLSSGKPALPSTEFLKLCIQVYFTRFNPTFPVLHGPTFQPSPKNGLLLLSICSIGSLFIGTIEATQQGVRLFEQLCQAIRESWDAIVSSDTEAIISVVQAALIGQTFGLLSGDPTHLAMVSASHCTSIAWARRAKMFEPENEPFNPGNLKGAQLVAAWRAWARREEVKRVALGLFVHDAEIAMLLHYEPILRRREKAIPLACCTDPFFARAVNLWVHLIQQDPSTASTYPPCLHTGRHHTNSSTQLPGRRCTHSMFTAYMLLEGIGAGICEDRVLGQLDADAVQRYERDLIAWYSQYRRPILLRSDRLCLMVLWHAIFMSLLADLHTLELAIGTKGPRAAAKARASLPPRWNMETPTKRCLLHAFLLQKLVESLPLGHLPAIHLPRCVFSAAVVWAVYLLYPLRPPDCPQGSSSSSPSQCGAEWSSVGDLDVELVPEMQIRVNDVDPEWLDMFASQSTSPDSIKGNMLCVLADLLRQMGARRIGQKFASVLAHWVHGDVKDDDRA